MNVAWRAVTAEQMRRLYWRQQLTDEEIGLMYGVTKSSVIQKRQRLGVEGRGPGNHPPALRNTGRSLRASGPWLR
jgi:hypothetical protein